MFTTFFRPHPNEIKEFLIENEFLLIEIVSPNKIDWDNSPFIKPKIPNLSSVFNNNFSLSTINDYRLISLKDNTANEILYWLEIRIGIFIFKTFTYRKSKVLKH